MWSPCFGLLCGFVWFGLVLLCSAGHGSGSPLLQTGCSIAHLALSLCSLACLSVFGLLGLQMTMKGLPIVPQGACACLHDVSCMPVCVPPSTQPTATSPQGCSLWTPLVPADFDGSVSCELPSSCSSARPLHMAMPWLGCLLPWCPGSTRPSMSARVGAFICFWKLC